MQRHEAERMADDLSRLIDTANAPIFGVDKAARVTVWNQKIAELSGFPADAVIGEPLVQNFISEEYRHDVALVLLRALGGETVPNFEIALYARDGVRREVLMNATPRLGDDGSVIGVIGVGHDITDIRRVTAEQKREAEDMARLVRCANAPILGVDIGGHLMEWNDKMVAMSGFLKEEVLGRSLIDDFVVEESKEAVQLVVEKANLDLEDLGEFDLQLHTKDGGQIVLTMSGATFRDTSGGVAGIIACGQDLTNIRNTMSELTRVAEDLTRLIDTANAPIFGIDVMGNVTEWNRKAAQISGFGKNEALGKPLVQTFITENYRKEVSTILRRALEGQEVANFEFPLFTKDGRRREILLNATTRCGAHGEVTGVIGVGQDITELRAAMADQQKLVDDLKRFISTANAPIFGVDTQGRVTEWNRKAAEISGYRKEECMGRLLVDEFITQEYKEKVQAVLTRAWKGEETANFEFPLMTKDGRKVAILLNATPNLDSHGKVTGVMGVGQDITHLRAAMAETAQVADDLVRLIDTANAPIFGIDVEGRVTEWNRKAAAITGFSKQETLGKPLVDTFITRSYREEVGRVLLSALQGHESGNYEFPLFTKDGRRRDILLNATTRRGADGQVTGVIGVGQDITELRTLMGRSQLVADDLQRLIETANAPIVGVDPRGCVNEWNRKAASITGFTKAETKGRPFVEFVDASAAEAVHLVLERALKGEEIDDFNLPLTEKGGKTRDILFNATPRRGGDGEVIGVVGVGQDVSELKLQKLEAERVAQDLRQIIDTASAPIIGIDTKCLITEWNERVEEVTGRSRKEVFGKDFMGYVSDSCRAEAHRVFTDAFNGKATPNVEILVMSKSQEQVVFLLSAAPRKGPEDSILGVICIGQDITYLKELEIKKGQIAAAITHELRSPLHGIIGLSDQLLSTDPNKGNRSLKLINNCARRLLDLVTNIMDLSTLVQSKHMVLARDPVQMAKLVEEVIVLTSMSVDKAGRPIRKKEVELINSVPSELPIIEADAHRCMQMLYNLVSNALKFTVKGKVEITAFPNDETEILTVIVEDTGIGIASQARDLIFRPFEQEDQSESRRYEGIGLGLSISKEVAVKHGGNLTVESELGKGSRFIVTLPYKPFFKEDTGDEEDDMAIGVINGPSGMFMQEDKGPITKDQPLPLEGGSSQKPERHVLPAAPPQPKPEDRRPKAPPATPSVFNRKKPEAKRKVLVDTNETEIAEISWRTPSGLEEQVHQKHSLDGYRLLSRMLPSGNAERILMGKDVVPEVCEDASVMVAVLRGWDAVASMRSMEQATAMLANLSQALETLSAPQGISIHKMFATEAEGLVAISGLDADPGHEARLLHFTAALKERVEELQGELPATAPKLSLAVGIDAGVVCRTIFGSQRPILSVLGSAVIGARCLNLQAQTATGSAIFASVNVLRRLSVSSGPVQVAGMTAVSAGRAQQGSVELPYFALLKEGEQLPVLESQAPVRPAADPGPQPAPPIPAPVESAAPAVPEPVSPGTLGALLEGFPRTMNGDAEQELFQLRSIAIALQRQNAHLHLENVQLRRHLGSVGPMLGQLAGLRAVAQEQAQESELRSKRMELELQFWKFQTGLTVPPTLSGWAPEF